MNPDTLYLIGCIAVAALATWLTRALPFLIFGNRELPRTVKYLSSALPPAIMVILVIYCLRNIDFASAAHGIPELASVALVALLQFWRKNMYLSILAGTVCYMVLLRVLN